jgi:hypothetical protein
MEASLQPPLAAALFPDLMPFQSCNLHRGSAAFTTCLHENTTSRLAREKLEPRSRRLSPSERLSFSACLSQTTRATYPR